MSSYEIPSYSVISPISVAYALSPPPPPRSLYNPYADPPPLPNPSPLTPPTEDAQPPTVLSLPPVCIETSPPPPSSIDYAPPPSSTPSPTPTLSPPPPSIAPSPNSPVSPSLPSSPPLPPPSPPSLVSPQISFIYSSPPPPPPLIDPPRSSPSPPPSIDPPRSSPSLPPSPNLPPPSPPPPLVEPPTKLFSPPPPSSSPPPPVLPPPSRSHTPPSNSPVPPPIPSPPSHPSNSPGGVNHSPPSVRYPTASSVPPFHPHTNSSSRIPFTPSSASSSDYSQNDSKGLGRNSSPKSSGVTTENVATIAAVTCFFMLTFVGAAMLFLRKRRYPLEPSGYADGFELPSRFGSPQVTVSTYPRSTSVPLVRYSSGSSGVALSEPGLGNSKFWFMYEELSTITSGFSSNNLLGEGGFGLVYKGCLHDGREVAVKQLKVGGAQGEREFTAEVEIISRVHHRHLVSLVGYCISEQHRLLVYDYVPNNTLYYHLHGNVSPALDWATRVKVASGAARGIAYLHEDCHPKIIHRDIKSSNILLDNDFEAQVSDFGLARLARDACTHVSTRVMGTFGYMAPEYASTGKLTAKSDVYSFGVVLLELLTGRKPVDSSQPMGDESLVEWARPLLSNALENRDFGDLPDPRLENNYNESEMFRMVEAAAACVRHSVVMRPQMGQVVRALDNLSAMDINNGVKPGQSQIFASGPQTEEIIRFQRRGFGSQDSGSDVNRASWKNRTYL